MTMKRTPIDFPQHNPFIEHLGFELLVYGEGRAELRLELVPEHLNSWNVAHGGVLMTLLDSAMGHAARSTVGQHPPHHAPGQAAPPSSGVATIEMKTSFLRPAEGSLRALGTVLHRSSTLAFCEGSVVDEAGRVCAHGTSTFKILRGLPSGARASKPHARAEPGGDGGTG